MKDEKSKKGKILLSMLVVLIILGLVGFNIYNISKLTEKNKTIVKKKEEISKLKEENKKLKTIEKCQTNTVVNREVKVIILEQLLENMKIDIKNKIATNGYKIHIDTCEGQLPDNITSNSYVLSDNAIDKIIDKLSAAKEVETGFTASFFCPKYSLGIYTSKENSIFSLNNADAKNKLIVYYDQAYAFAYDEDVSSYISDLLK